MGKLNCLVSSLAAICNGHSYNTNYNYTRVSKPPPTTAHHRARPVVVARTVRNVRAVFVVSLFRIVLSSSSSIAFSHTVFSFFFYFSFIFLLTPLFAFVVISLWKGRGKTKQSSHVFPPSVRARPTLPPWRRVVIFPFVEVPHIAHRALTVPHKVPWARVRLAIRWVKQFIFSMIIAVAFYSRRFRSEHMVCVMDSLHSLVLICLDE